MSGLPVARNSSAEGVLSPSRSGGRASAGARALPPDALDGLFLAQRPQLLAFVRALVRDADAAEEIVQETWLRLAIAVAKGTALEDPERWFRGVARNLALHHFRARRTAKVVADGRFAELLELAFEERSASRDADPSADRRRWLAGCVAKLPDKARNLLHLKYTSGMTAAEIGRQSGRTEEAILKALSRLRKLLGDCVQARQRADEGECHPARKLTRGGVP